MLRLAWEWRLVRFRPRRQYLASFCAYWADVLLFFNLGPQIIQPNDIAPLLQIGCHGIFESHDIYGNALVVNRFQSTIEIGIPGAKYQALQTLSLQQFEYLRNDGDIHAFLYVAFGLLPALVAIGHNAFGIHQFDDELRARRVGGLQPFVE